LAGVTGPGGPVNTAPGPPREKLGAAEKSPGASQADQADLEGKVLGDRGRSHIVGEDHERGAQHDGNAGEDDLDPPGKPIGLRGAGLWHGR
jgi:hypothetical protein